MQTVYLVATFAFFVTAAIQGLLALAILTKKDKSETDWVFIFAMAATAHWCLSNALASSCGTVLEEPNGSLGGWLYLTSYPVLYTVPPAMRHCVASELGMPIQRKWRWAVLNYAPVIPLMLLFWNTSLASRHFVEGPVVGLLFLVYTVLAVTDIRRGRSHHPKLQANMTLMPGYRLVFGICLGSAIFFPTVMGALCHLFPEFRLQVSLVPKLGAALPVTLALAYIILRYRFMDIILKRSVLYTVLAGLLLGLYLVLVNSGAAWLFPEGKLRAVALDLLVILILIFAFQPLKVRLQQSIDRLFFRRRLEGATLLQSFSQTLTSWSDLAGLCQSFVDKAQESLGVTSSTVLFADGAVHSTQQQFVEPSALQPVKRALGQTAARITRVEELADGELKSACRASGIGLIAVLPGREQHGWLLLGEKAAREPFLSEEIALIEAVCGQFATAIDNLSLTQTKIALEREVQHREKLAAVGQLAATVAHEIRNPITGAKCLLQQVEEDLTGAPQSKEYVQLALEDLDRVEQSISQLLSFARKEEYHFAQANVTDLVQSAVQSFTVQAQEKAVAVQVEEEPPSIQAAIDGEKLHRSLWNLLLNALDAVSRGGRIGVQVGTHGSDVTICVSDNGCGLPQEDQAKIFEPFFTKKEKGTGLGLAIAQKIIERHGGRISVASMLGQGTTFTLAFPRQRVDAEAVA